MDIKGPGYRIQPAHCRHTVAVQRAICALNRNALWNNARLPLVTKNITAVAQRVSLVRGVHDVADCHEPFSCASWIRRAPIGFGIVYRTNRCSQWVTVCPERFQVLLLPGDGTGSKNSKRNRWYFWLYNAGIIKII